MENTMDVRVLDSKRERVMWRNVKPQWNTVEHAGKVAESQAYLYPGETFSVQTREATDSTWSLESQWRYDDTLAEGSQK
jgi:hypothetical protein